MNYGPLRIIALTKIFLICGLLAIAPIRDLAQTATIHVRVLDGRTGKNLSGMDLLLVDYYSAPDGGAHPDLNGRAIVKASIDGDTYVANPNTHEVLVFDTLDIDGAWMPCTRQKFYDTNTGKYGSEHLYPVSAIMASGLITKNSCSKRTATAKPGELILFIRPTTWWERFIWGLES